MCTKTNNHQNPNKNNRIRQSTIIQLQSDSSPLQAAGHKPSPRTRQIRDWRGRSRAFSGLGSLLDRTSAARRSAPTGPDTTVQTTPIYTQKPSNHHATAARCKQRATNPLPAQGRFGTDGAEAGPLAVWASLLDRTSAARRSAPTGPDATVQTQYRRYKKAPAAEGLFCIMRLKLIHQLS